MLEQKGSDNGMSVRFTLSPRTAELLSALRVQPPRCLPTSGSGQGPQRCCSTDALGQGIATDKSEKQVVKPEAERQHVMDACLPRPFATGWGHQILC